MPIVGTTTSTEDLSDWSHSTVFTTTITTFIEENLPPLLSVWIPPATCRDRWMVSRPGPEPQEGQNGRTIWAFSTYPTINSEPSDKMYVSCQPYQSMAFSPGVCPEGRTVAEVTLFLHNKTTGGVGDFYQASCCPRGMSFGTQAAYKCVSDITKSLKGFDLLTAFPYSGASTLTTDYEWVTYSFINSDFGSDGYSTISVSNVTAITSGTAIADPIVIGWQVEDMSKFPTAYASSLANKIGVTLETSSAIPARSSSLPRQTDTPSPTPNTTPSDGLSIGAKAGIGVGAVFGSLLIGGAALLYFSKRKRRQTTPTRAGVDVAEMEDQDQALASKKWYLFGKWRNEHAGEERRHELDSKSVNVVPGPPVELPTNELRQHNDSLGINE